MTATCDQCGATLNRHNVTGLCAECKLIARNARLSGQPAEPAEPITLADAIANFAAVFADAKVIQGERS